jgi:hypothetical protein
MAIRIDQGMAKIGMHRTPSSLETRTHNAEINVQHESTKIKIDFKRPSIKIDNSGTWDNLGYRDIVSFMKAQARKGYQRYLKYVGETSADGERLSAIEKGGNPIRDIAVREAYETDGADPIGRAAPPKFDVEGYIEIDVQNNKLDPFAGVTMKATRAEIDFYYTPSRLSIYLEQKAYLNITYLGENVDLTV